MRYPTSRILVFTLAAALSPAVGAAESPSPTHTNSIGMEFVLIPAGTFQMGCSSEEEDCDSDEKPRHAVTISKPFYLGKFEVTQAQWEAVMGNRPSKFKGPDRPVERVSWEDAREFIKKLNAKEGHERYRLPTEAEWEHAARAGSAATWSFGMERARLKDHAWYWDNSGKQTHPVGRKEPNAWGLHDMYGNVFEWVEDWYGKEFYTPGAAVDPRGPRTGGHRAMRGGGWHSTPGECRSSYRDDDETDYRSGDTGFRLALSADQ